jgi:ubiquinone biosynthesis protein
VFVKFGQLLSVRPDLIPDDVADDLAKLQDEVPPFSWSEVEGALARAYGRPHAEVFATFENVPVASASVAQVHFATLPDGREVAVKILRPGIAEVIAQDVDLLYALAGLIERTADGRRLRPREVVAEFEKTIADELDLLREAANASQLRRNFADGRLLIVPEVYWDWCNRDAMVMQRIDGIPVNAVERLRAAGIDIARLARDGVEIFFTQVFRDGFFHADMHPGNIFVAADGRYCGVDFGIMGTLSDVDKRLPRDQLHGVLPPRLPPRARSRTSTRAGCRATRAWTSSRRDPLGVRADLRPAAEGHLLRQAADAALRGLAALPHGDPAAAGAAAEDAAAGRGPGPAARSELDLRRTAQPILERWMNEQVGVRGLAKQLRDEAPLWSRTLPQLPRLMHRVLTDDTTHRLEVALARLEAAQLRQTLMLRAIALILAAMVAGLPAASLSGVGFPLQDIGVAEPR